MMEQVPAYGSFEEWAKDNPIAARDLKRHKHVAEFKRNLGWSSYWTDEELIANAKKYKTKTEWARNESYSYAVARKKGNIFLKGAVIICDLFIKHGLIKK